MRTDRALLVVALAAATSACAGTLDDPERFELASPPSQAAVTSTCPDASDVPTTIFAAKCATSGCHDASAHAAAGLDLASPGIRARLAGKTAAGGPGTLLDPANADSSVLYTKTAIPAPFGSAMPLGAAALDDAARACLAAWIASGT